MTQLMGPELRGCLNHGLLFLFLIRYPGLGRGGRKDCAFVGILKDFRISVKTLGYYA